MRTLLVLFLVLAAACSRPEPPTLTPERVRVVGLTLSQISLEVTLDVDNPNGIDLVARSLEAHLVIAKNIDIGTVDIPVTTVFAAHATTKLVVPVQVKLTDIAPLARLAIAGADLDYTVDGTVGLGGELVRVNVPYHLTGTVPRDQVAKAAMTALPGLNLTR